MDQSQDANEPVGEPTETDSSPVLSTDYEPIIDDDGFVSTTDFKTVEPEPAKTDTSEKTEQKTESTNQETKGFADHPRFQELIREKNELKERLAKIEAQNQPKEQQRKSKYNFKNIMQMEDEEIVGQITETPKAFLANLAQQIAHEIRTDFEAEAAAQSEQAKVQTTQQKALDNMRSFFEDKEDGIAMLKDGTIKAFLDNNPGHNPISAYHAIVGEKVYEERLKKEIEKEREKINQELKAAGKIKPIKSNSSTPSNQVGRPKLADNKSDLKRIILEKARARQA